MDTEFLRKAAIKINNDSTATGDGGGDGAGVVGSTSPYELLNQISDLDRRAEDLLHQIRVEP